MSAVKGPMSWNAAQKLLDKGWTVMRGAWRPNTFVKRTGGVNMKYTSTLEADRSTKFVPTGADQSATDWYGHA